MKYLSYSENTLELLSLSAEDTFALGTALGRELFPGALLLLYGGLGMGKTKLTQGIGAALGIQRVKSPSFIIMSEYDGPLPLLHADLYRLEGKGQADALAIEEYLEQGFAAVIEWAERWSNPPESEIICIEFSRVENKVDERKIKITASGAESSELLHKIKAAAVEAEKNKC